MLANLPAYIANARKALVNITGLAASLLALGLLPSNYAAWGATVVAVLTVVTHYMTPNAPAPGSEPALEEFAPEDEPVPEEFQPAALITASQIATEHQIAAPPDSEI